MPRKLSLTMTANLVALIDREHVEHPVERAGGAARVQRAQHEVTRFRGADGERDRLQIAHFADHDHIRVLAQRAAQRRREGARVRMHLTLGDVAAAARMMYSMGSSSVMMWSCRCRLISCTSAASVVDLPLPTGPVTSTRPLWYSVSFLRLFGSPSSSIVRILDEMMRKTRSMPSRCRTTLVRKRPKERGISKIHVALLLQPLELRLVEEAMCASRLVSSSFSRGGEAENGFEVAVAPPERGHVDTEMDIRGGPDS